MKTHHINRTLRIWSAGLLSMLILASCGVTEPDASSWQDVRNFSWPTATGTVMKYRTTTNADNTTEDKELIVERASVLESTVNYHGQDMFVLADTNSSQFAPSDGLHFLPQQDTLYVKNDLSGIEFALVSPLKKGQRWVAAYNGQDTSMVAEIIELFAYRKVEGITYRNVVAVKYQNLVGSSSSTHDKEEWIRFFAEGIGEIETIKNNYSSSTSSSEPLPERESSTVLIETSLNVN